MNLELFFAINKNLFENEKNDVSLKNIIQSEKNYILYNKSQIDKSLIDFTNSEETKKELFIDKKNLMAYKSKLTDVSGKDLGFKIILIDLTNEYYKLQKHSLNYVLIMFFGTFFILLIGYFFSKQKQK